MDTGQKEEKGNNADLGHGKEGENEFCYPCRCCTAHETKPCTTDFTAIAQTTTITKGIHRTHSRNSSHDTPAVLVSSLATLPCHHSTAHQQQSSGATDSKPWLCAPPTLCIFVKPRPHIPVTSSSASVPPPLLVLGLPSSLNPYSRF
ncbi:multidrug transporter [Sesbania bispinosa]|nr:multidrug transporter [Sesbania bispinosa]